MAQKHRKINIKSVHQDRRRKVNLINRFWSKVAKAGRDECWLWTAAKYSTGGYGIFQIGRKTFLAHRVSFALTNPFDPEKQVLHKCDVRSCVNPKHLYLGTQGDNLRDAYARGRKLPVRMRGEQGTNAKLTQAKVDEIRRLYAETDLVQEQIARLFGISQWAVSSIVNRKRWVE